MFRTYVIVALAVFFLLLNFSHSVLAQVSDPSDEQRSNFETGKNVNSLTTTDLLSSQDFAPQSPDLPAKRSRYVNPGKGSKNSVEARPQVANAGSAKSLQEPIIQKGYEVGSDVMTQAQRPVVNLTEKTVVQPIGNISPNVATGNVRIDDLITQAAARNGIDHHLILAVMKQESSFNPQAVSYKGARGLMQLMPATAARFGVRDIFDPAQNIEGGARYLRFLLDTFNGDVELALAGYNAGEGAVMRYGNQIPPYRETQDYVRKISAHYARLKDGNYVRVQPTLRQPVMTQSVAMQTNTSMLKGKKGESGILTVGQTMTQY